jgi:hypothetical protein
MQFGCCSVARVGNLVVNDVLSQETLHFNCHSGLDPESSLFNPAKGGTGVYAVLETGRE